MFGAEETILMLLKGIAAPEEVAVNAKVTESPSTIGHSAGVVGVADSSSSVAGSSSGKTAGKEIPNQQML